jgi:hypothetical protein
MIPVTSGEEYKSHNFSLRSFIQLIAALSLVGTNILRSVLSPYHVKYSNEQFRSTYITLALNSGLLARASSSPLCSRDKKQLPVRKRDE